jgi:hypothetical protein
MVNIIRIEDAEPVEKGEGQGMLPTNYTLSQSVHKAGKEGWGAGGHPFVRRRLSLRSLW